jgi:hypothetical protein
LELLFSPGFMLGLLEVLLPGLVLELTLKHLDLFIKLLVGVAETGHFIGEVFYLLAQVLLLLLVVHNLGLLLATLTQSLTGI